MCLAAKTPSTIAQQKAATTPKLINTIDATNCGRKQHQLHDSTSLFGISVSIED